MSDFLDHYLDAFHYTGFTPDGVLTVRQQGAPPPPKYKPFNLEAAKRGEKIQSKYGGECTFVAHVPCANPESQLVLLHPSGEISTRYSNGRLYNSDETGRDIVMAPSPPVEEERVAYLVKASEGLGTFTFVQVCRREELAAVRLRHGSNLLGTRVIKVTEGVFEA